MMYTPRSEPPLRYFKSAPFTKQAIFLWHAYVFEFDMHVTVRRVVVTEHRDRT